jgi:hypothetical protein
MSNLPLECPDYRPLELMKDPKITKYEFSDFIGVWDNFFPAGLCDDIINFSDTVFTDGCVFGADESFDDEGMPYESSSFYGGELNRKDFAFLMPYHDRKLTLGINSCLKSCVRHYVSQYQTLVPFPLLSTDIKVQKTPPGGGYHLWHYENSIISHAMRELVWMVYLNDMPDGEAETEFLYQKRRIKPTKGTVVVWPAGFTHTHKGNTVLTQDKYILTGWYIKTK